MYRVPGFLESVNITIDNTTPWEINLDNDQTLAQLPQVVDVSVTFKPIMDVLPKRPNTISTITNTQYNANQGTATETLSVSSGVVPLIVNVPKSSPQSADTFIKANISQQFSRERDASLSELRVVDPVLNRDLEIAEQIAANQPIPPIKL